MFGLHSTFPTREVASTPICGNDRNVKAFILLTLDDCLSFSVRLGFVVLLCILWLFCLWLWTALFFLLSFVQYLISYVSLFFLYWFHFFLSSTSPEFIILSGRNLLSSPYYLLQYYFHFSFIFFSCPSIPQIFKVSLCPAYYWFYYICLHSYLNPSPTPLNTSRPETG